MPRMSTRPQRTQSPDVLLHNDLAHDALNFSTDAASWQTSWDSDAGSSSSWPPLPEIPSLSSSPEACGPTTPVVHSNEIPEDEHTLSTRYTAMLDNRSETCIFDRYDSMKSDKYETELCRLLRDAFDLENLGPSDSNQIMQQIVYNSNYSVETVTRVMNKQQYKMHQAFAENYGIHSSRTVYHGTTEEGAKSIETVGFKASAGRRAKFGKGIYSSPLVWEALGYAKPYNDARQVFFVVELLQGPTTLGSEDQIDFGVDTAGHEILTLTNPEATILCASKENQMLATYRITMRYMFESPFLFRHRECVRIVHQDIATLIKHARANADAAAAAATAPAPLPTAAAALLATATSTALKNRLQYVSSLQINTAPVVRPVQIAFHSWFKVGQTVHITGTLKAYREFVGKSGIICRIVKAPRHLFCVRLDDDALRSTVRIINALPENKARFSFLMTSEDDLVVLKVDQLVLYKLNDTQKQAAQLDTSLGKRKA